MNDKSIAIIPARGGSKRIPRKNIKEFLGKPIIQYSIDTARESGCFDEIMVSTDDDEIAQIAISLGANIPFYRSEKNSDEHAGLADVLEEVLLEYRNREREFKYCCCILPTAPFISVERIKNAFEILKNNIEADDVIPVVRFSYPIQRALKIDGKFLKMIWPENYNERSQDLEPCFHDSGQFYWLNVNSFMKSKRLLMDKTLAVELSESEVQDIDTEEDWKIAETKFRILKNII